MCEAPVSTDTFVFIINEALILILFAMSSGVFVFDVVVTLVLSGWLLFRYGDWMRHRVAVTVAVLVAWYFSFLIIFILPLDVSSTTYRQCKDLEQKVIKNATTTVLEASQPGEDDGVNGTSVVANATLAPPQQQALSIQHCEQPYSLLPENVLLNLWRVVYWSSQLLTWLVLPLMQSYTTVL